MVRTLQRSLPRPALDVRNGFNDALTPPAHYLCPDLVGYLFLLTADLEADCWGCQKTILSASQVCHSWRLVALSIKSLWSRLVDFEANSQAWCEELLHRSHPLPLDVGCWSFIPRELQIISRELDHLDRIRTYRVAFEDSTWPTLVEKLSKPAPQIERLTITHPHPSTSKFFVLPQALFGGHAPRFRHLELTQCIPDFRSPLVNGLTSLSVLNLNLQAAPSAIEWLGHLTRMPRLVKLALEGAIRPDNPYIERAPFSQVEPTRLPLLQYLQLDATLDDLAILLHNLDFPRLCAMDLICSNARPGVELDVVQEAYKTRLQYAHQVAPTACPLLIYARGVSLSFSNEPNSLEIQSHGSSPDIPNLCLDLKTSHSGSWETLLPTSLKFLGEVFSSVTSLDLQIPAVNSELISYLTLASKVKTLRNLSATMTKKTLQALQTTSDTGLMPLPSLDTILLADNESMWGPAYRNFEAFLRWRSKMDHPIQRISFHRCFVMEDKLAALERLGVRADCDTRGMRWGAL